MEMDELLTFFLVLSSYFCVNINLQKMKSIFLLVSIAALFGFMGCSTDNFFPKEEENQLIPIQLTSRVITTRGIDLQEQNSQIKENQVVGVTITGASSNHENVRWLADGNGVLTNQGASVYYNGTDIIDVFAYQPFNSSWKNISEEANTFFVQSDQSLEGFANSDLLWAKASSSPNNSSVSLEFHHVLSKINIILVSADGFDVADSSISICGTDLGASFKAGVASVILGTKNEICAGIHTDRATAIIVPQEIAAGVPFVKITISGKDYYYKLPNNSTFKGGVSYTYSLKINFKQELVLLESMIKDWEEEFCEGVLNIEKPDFVSTLEASIKSEESYEVDSPMATPGWGYVNFIDFYGYIKPDYLVSIREMGFNWGTKESKLENKLDCPDMENFTYRWFEFPLDTKIFYQAYAIDQNGVEVVGDVMSLETPNSYFVEHSPPPPDDCDF